MCSSSNCWAAHAAKILFIWFLLQQAHSDQDGCNLPKPKFSSVNMHTVLTWSPVNISSGVLYDVKYKMYGSYEWQNKVECTQINKTWCDLSNETYDFSQKYFGMVTATYKGKNCSNESQKFYPFLDTTIGPPAVEVERGDRSILIHWSYPKIWKRSPTDRSLENVYKLDAKIVISNNKNKEEWVVKRLDVKDLDPNTTYCVNITLIDPSLGKSSESAVTCETTPIDRTSDEVVKMLFIVTSLIMTIILILVIICVVYNYIHVSKLKYPQNLNLPAGTNNVIFNVDSDNVKFYLINADQDFCKLKMQETCLSCENRELKSEPQKTNEDIMENESDIMEKDLGYATLKQNVSFIKPSITPYDMPHYFPKQPPSSEPAEVLELVNTEDSKYGKMKENSAICSVHKDNILGVTENAYKAHTNSVTYVPKAFDESINQCNGKVEEIPVNYISNNLPQELNVTNFYNDNFAVDWSPTSFQLNVLKLCKENTLEDSINEEEGLLSKLYVPVKPEDCAEEDEIIQFSERWGLKIQMPE
ncbi:interleukin-20 receptor subunit alpha [Bombina bombina]|uniref:interleukin-20 receptor subunit alpha n=1 Tax=Bombina bombina TaxID=8345 RepID=UPI00235A7A52|nr:interleukin-20 receptor subunit alpha [Bombina bombina]